MRSERGSIALDALYGLVTMMMLISLLTPMSVYFQKEEKEMKRTLLKYELAELLALKHRNGEIGGAQGEYRYDQSIFLWTKRTVDGTTTLCVTEDISESTAECKLMYEGGGG
ncbi:hypothetical protein G4V62_00850 [Bacillaceae bacterium SIJ1]|uniref:hypothetical protein n=1 Tax=Litoribacterium kuwaitense TaxID=1398745 RepID=UPI0013EA7575|nr:hypothetical protein [Litoribacterium kuwaitense]NGP43577.1 hypothetical protein [Litoribacterium kuwaitense]